MDFDYGARPRAYKDHDAYGSSKATRDHLVASPQWPSGRTPGYGGGTSAHSNLDAGRNHFGILESPSETKHAATDKRVGRH